MNEEDALGLDSLSTREVELLDAAAQVFMERGYSATTIDAVADSIGLTKGSFYYYYRSKTDLFFAVHRRAMALNLAAVGPLAAASDVPVHRKLWNMAREHTLLMLRHLPYQRVTVQGLELHLTQSTTPEQRTQMTELLQLRDRYEELFRGVLDEGATSGAFRSGTSSVLVKPLLGALNWTTMWYRPRQGETAHDQELLADELADFALASVLPLERSARNDQTKLL